MDDRDSKLLTILRIGHETSMRGHGLSLRQALNASRYVELRRHFEASDLVPLIRKDGDFVKQWIMYSEDKRTSGGWYLLRDGSVGRPSNPQPDMHFESIEEAVAEYVVRELDFWSGVQEPG